MFYKSRRNRTSHFPTGIDSLLEFQTATRPLGGQRAHRSAITNRVVSDNRHDGDEQIPKWKKHGPAHERRYRRDVKRPPPGHPSVMRGREGDPGTADRYHLSARALTIATG